MQTRRTTSGIAALVAVALAGGHGAAERRGTTPQGEQPQPVYQQQLVTVEGCLARERAPEEVTRELASDPEEAAIFVLMDTAVRSRIDTTPGAPAADPRVLGPAGIQNERVGLPVDPPAADDDKSAERERARAIEGSPTPAIDRYVVAGLPDDRLKPFAGQRVALTGQFDRLPAATRRVVRQDPEVQQRLMLLPEGYRIEPVLTIRSSPTRSASRSTATGGCTCWRCGPTCSTPTARARGPDQPHLAPRGHQRRRRLRPAHGVRRQPGDAAHCVPARATA
jgi:hypothetical protein